MDDLHTRALIGSIHALLARAANAERVACPREKSEPKEEASQKTIARATGINAGESVLIFLASLGYVYYARDQWNAIDNQVRIMRSQPEAMEVDKRRGEYGNRRLRCFSRVLGIGPTIASSSA